MKKTKKKATAKQARKPSPTKQARKPSRTSLETKTHILSHIALSMGLSDPEIASGLLQIAAVEFANWYKANVPAKERRKS